MAKDYGEMEREFIAGLKDDTGKDLAEWMAAIAAQRFTDKNDAIDWLRGQGFIFNWASWLERIHANGGRPIYAGKPSNKTTIAGSPPAPDPSPGVGVGGRVDARGRADSGRRQQRTQRANEERTRHIVPSPVVPEARVKYLGEGQGGGDGRARDDSTASNKTTTAGRPPTPTLSPPGGGESTAKPALHGADLETLIAAAKGYQPLYRLLAAEIAKALPQVRMSAAAGYISVSRPAEFGAIETGPKGLRLALDLGDRPFDPPLQPAKLTGPPKRLSHMLVLDDARQVDGRLMELIKAADARVNPA